MIRFIILALVGYVVYRAVKTWMFQDPSSSESVTGKKAGEIDDTMIKDPYCEAYFPKRNAVNLKFNGEDLQFCSTQCKDKFLASHTEKKYP
jgi:YHS domain-containing protein